MYTKKALRVALGFGNFPYQLMLIKNVKNPVPAVYFTDSVASVGGLFNREQKICHANRKFHRKIYREIFTNTQIKHTTGKEARAWPAGPNMKYWPQQLNFALWHETTCCGISWDILLDREMQVSLQLRAFLRYFVIWAYVSLWLCDFVCSDVCCRVQ